MNDILNRQLLSVTGLVQLEKRIRRAATPEEFGAFVRREIAQWREVARLANVRLEG